MKLSQISQKVPRSQGWYRTRGSRRIPAALAVLAVLGRVQADSLQIIPPLSGGAFVAPSGVSGNGSVVSGTSFFPSEDADRGLTWTSGGGSQAIVGAPISFGLGISANGTTAVGMAFNDDFNIFAYRYRNNAMESLGSLDGTGFNAQANGVNQDGSVVTGQSTLAGGTDRAFRWTSAGMQNLGVLAGGTYSLGLAINGVGDVVVGNGNANGASRAFRWTESGGMTALGSLAGSSFDGAYAVTKDGNTIAGISAGNAVRWVNGTAFSLGSVADVTGSSAQAVSGNGQLIGGTAMGSPTRGSEAFVWSSGTGMLLLEDLLASRGVDLTGWELQWVTGISADGTALVGTGTFNGHSAGWVVKDALKSVRRDRGS